MNNGSNVISAMQMVICAIVICITGCADSDEKFTLDLKTVDHKCCAVSNISLEMSLPSPEVGVAYVNGFGDMVVNQVIKGVGVLAFSERAGRCVFVKTKRLYVDGVGLQSGLYVCAGTCQYIAVSGANVTVFAFEEMEPELSNKRLAEIREEKLKEEMKRRKLEEQQRFEEEKCAIEERQRQLEIERELQKQKEENERKLAAIRATAEMEEAKRRQEEAEKAEEERKKRYPMEQKQRAEYAKVKLSPISFKISSYFEMQRDLKRYVYSASITEKKWAELQRLQSENNWLGMLAAIAEAGMTDYPEEKEIDELVGNLKKQPFHVEILFTHTIEYTPGIEVSHWSNLGRIGSLFREYKNTGSAGHGIRRNRRDNGRSWDGELAQLVVQFCIEDGKDCIIYCAQSDQKEDASIADDLFDVVDNKARKALDKIESDQQLGRINASEAASARDKIREKYVDLVKAKLITLKCKMGRAVRRNPTGSVQAMRESLCQDCNGEGKIKKELTCKKCDGTGIGVKYKLGLNNTTRRIEYKCANCHGKGIVVRESPCSTCKGLGRIQEK